MQKNTLIRGWDAVAVSEVCADREAIVGEIGMALIERLAQSLPEYWDVEHTITALEGSNDYMLDVSAHDEDGLRQVNFKAGFDFAAKLSWIENFSVITDRGNGLGRGVFTKFLKQAGEKGFTKANLQSTDIGSYFWITQGVEPSTRSGLQGLIAKIDLRLDVLGKWLPSEPVTAAQEILSQAKDNPQKLRDLAKLDFRAEIAQAFMRPDYKAETLRRETEGWTNGFMDEVEAQLANIAIDRSATQTLKLGHLLFVSTAWHGSIVIPPSPGPQ